MSLFPPSSDLEYLVGKEISRIIFGTGGVHFCWWGGGQIHAMRDFEHTDEQGNTHEFGEGAWRDPPSLLHRLIQRKVVELDVAHNSLTLIFNCRQSLRFLAHEGVGENGLIQFEEDLSKGWIVF